jgi:hypothetical protein
MNVYSGFSQASENKDKIFKFLIVHDMKAPADFAHRRNYGKTVWREKMTD